MSGDRPALSYRLATEADLPALASLTDAAIALLQCPFLDEAGIAASRRLMGQDSQLLRDRTYFVVEAEGRIAGCGGWSRRATLCGGDASPGRDATLLDPARDAARIRAMYTHPDFARRGVGRLILAVSEAAARAHGFRRAELIATLSGFPLYRACGYAELERYEDTSCGAPVPLVRMGKPLVEEEQR